MNMTSISIKEHLKGDDEIFSGRNNGMGSVFCGLNPYPKDKVLGGPDFLKMLLA